MDLTKRLDKMDREVKLLKNEIKRVLLEIQEHLLGVQSPFGGPWPGASAPSRAQEVHNVEVGRSPPPVSHEQPAPPPGAHEQAAQGEPEPELSREGAEEHVPAPDDGPDAGTASCQFVDLGTMAALAQWTENVVDKVALESLERLLDIAEMRGKLSPTHKRIILSLAALLGSRGQGEALSAREMISWMAQLDALLLPRTAADAMLIQFLLQGKLEEPPLARQ